MSEPPDPRVPSGRAPRAHVAVIGSADTHDLRLKVLRAGTPSTSVVWTGDELESTVHLGVLLEGSDAPIAIATWLLARSPDLDHGVGVQLRGMATDPRPDLRNRGYGSLLLDVGIDLARARAEHLWANARSDVIGFYVSRGFSVVGDEFETHDTGIAHRRILLDLR